MIGIIIALVLLLLFSILTYFFTKTWRALHVIAVFLCFVMSVVFIAMAASALKTQATWKSLVKNLKGQLAQATQEGSELSQGDLLQAKQAEPSVRSATAKLTRILYDRGRVWRRCVPQNIAGGQVTLSTIPPGTPDDQAAKMKHGMNTDLVVYAFKDIQLPDNSIVPGVFLGEFKITASTDNTVTMAPSLPLDQVQAAEANQANATWTLYEMMPLDSHRAFSRAEDVYEPLDNTENQPIFGELEVQQLQQVFAIVLERARPQLSPEQRNQVLQTMLESYVRDGTKGDRQMDDPDKIWMKVIFLKPYKVEVDSDAADPSLSGGFFDPSGRAVVPQLRRGSPVEFKENEIGVFDREYAEGVLIKNGIAKLIAPVYVRKLNDYQFDFHAIFERGRDVDEATRRAQRDIANLERARQNTQQQIGYRQEEKTKLEADLAGFTKEQEVITSLVSTVGQQRDEALEHLSQLWQTNIALERELAMLQQKLTDEINRRTAEAGVAGE